MKFVLKSCLLLFVEPKVETTIAFDFSKNKSRFQSPTAPNGDNRNQNLAVAQL